MDRRILPLLPLSALALTGFTAPAAPIAPSAANVALGQRAYADGPIVEPVRVLEDSRCPVNVRCIWAGTVRVQMRWHRPGRRAQDFTVKLGDPTPLADGSILLMAVRPEKHTEKRIKRRHYRFDLRFDGGL